MIQRATVYCNALFERRPEDHPPIARRAARAVTSHHLITEVMVRGEHRELGKVRTRNMPLWHDPERTIYADAIFFASVSLPLRHRPEGGLDTIPDLAVEVVGLNDMPSYRARKFADYLTAGVRVVWVANPTDRTITEHRPGADPVIDQLTDLLM